MTTLEILPFILFIVVIATAISERISIPYPLLLVIAGLILGFLPGIPNWHPPSDVVLPIFLPPILFAAARMISWRDVRNHKATIGSLSIVLVVVTTIAIAIILDWFIPNISLSTALVLGAIISPTDTTAANAILSKMHVKPNIIRTVEVESLFNDAMGIVLYKTALLFVILGTYNVFNLSLQTLVVGIGGVAVGFVFSYFTNLIIEQFLTDSENELPIIMSLVLAYVAYLFAERIGVSGVLAVVTAGLYHKKTDQIIGAKTRLTESAVWKTLIFFLNGIIFITIGIQFPTYLKKVNYITPMNLILFSLLTIIVILTLRFTWVTLTASTEHLLYRIFKPIKKRQFSWKKIIIVSWSGMRGLVSLALAIAIPMTIAPNKYFPHRDLIIFLTIITILFTLLVQGLTLPSLIKWLHVGKDDEKTIDQTTKIYRQLTEHAMNNIDEWKEKEIAFSTEAQALVKNYYANRSTELEMGVETERKAYLTHREAGKLMAKMLQYERNILFRMQQRGEINEDSYIRILRKLDRDEVGFASYQ